jgi:hypothetical protein
MQYYVADLPWSTARFGDLRRSIRGSGATLLAEFEPFAILASPTACLPEATGATVRGKADQVEINFSGGTIRRAWRTTTGCRALQS